MEILRIPKKCREYLAAVHVLAGLACPSRGADRCRYPRGYSRAEPSRNHGFEWFHSGVRVASRRVARRVALRPLWTGMPRFSCSLTHRRLSCSLFCRVFHVFQPLLLFLTHMRLSRSSFIANSVPRCLSCWMIFPSLFS